MNCECGSPTIVVGPIRVCSYCKKSYSPNGEEVHGASELSDVIAKVALEGAETILPKGSSQQELSYISGRLAELCTKVWLEGFKQGLLVGTIRKKD